jgi:hypothetical protein
VFAREKESLHSWAPRQTPPSSREAARAGFAELVQNHGSGR